MATTTGFHACSKQFVDRLRDGKLSINDWEFSTNAYDWLGDGIYFWEGSLRRAQEWAREFVVEEAAIIEAEVELGRCFDLTATDFLDLLSATYEILKNSYQENNWKLPTNRDLRSGSRWNRSWMQILDRVNAWIYPILTKQPFLRSTIRPLRNLDCLVINEFLSLTESNENPIYYQTVRSPFEEGDFVFPGSMIRRQTHIQISVRDRTCIHPTQFHSV